MFVCKIKQVGYNEWSTLPIARNTLTDDLEFLQFL